MPQTTRAMSGPAVQRWRVEYRRHNAALRMAQRDASAVMESAIAASALPVAVGEGAHPRPRLMFGPAVPSGVVAEEELLDLFLTERRTSEVARTVLEQSAPADHSIVGIHDVWIGAPSLSASVTAADYRVELNAGIDRHQLTRAVEELLAVERLERERDRGGKLSHYDLRPLIDDIRIALNDDRCAMEMRLRIDQQLGTGRPDEVLAAIRGLSGLTLEPASQIIRGRLHLSSA